MRLSPIKNKEKLDITQVRSSERVLQVSKCSPSMTVNHRVCATSKHPTWTERQTLKSDRWLHVFFSILVNVLQDKTMQTQLLANIQGLQVTAEIKDIDSLMRLSGRMECESPNRHLYEFVGNIRLVSHRWVLLPCMEKFYQWLCFKAFYGPNEGACFCYI